MEFHHQGFHFIKAQRNYFALYKKPKFTLEVDVRFVGCDVT